MHSVTRSAFGLLLLSCGGASVDGPDPSASSDAGTPADARSDPAAGGSGGLLIDVNGPPPMEAGLCATRHVELTEPSDAGSQATDGASNVGCAWKWPEELAGDGVGQCGRVWWLVLSVDGVEQDAGPLLSYGPCGDGRGGYVDDGVAPSIVQLCPKTCDIAAQSPATRVFVTWNCTQIPC